MATRSRQKPPAEPWGEGRLGRVLSLTYDAFGKRGHVDAVRVSEQLGVTPGTVRRWVRAGLPARRRELFAARVLPNDPALEQERRELAYAREALTDIYGLGGPVNPAWQEQGWLEPHVLAVVEIDRLGICVPRIARADGDQKTRERMRAGGGVIIDQDVFPNRFAAQVAKGELLALVAAWRVILPHGFINRGRTETWLKEAPRKRVSWFVEHPAVKPPARRRAKPKTSGTRRSSSTRKPPAPRSAD